MRSVSLKTVPNATVYVADADGDCLPLHSHDDAGHTTEVVSGCIEVFDDEGRTLIVNAGDPPVRFRRGRRHGIRARAGTVFVSAPPGGTG